MIYKFEKPVAGEIGIASYKCSIEWRNGKIIADEPITSGGQDDGPDPYSLLLSSIVSCTLITLRMYIDRKEWNIPSISVNANMFQTTKDEKITTYIDRDIKFGTQVSDEQRDKLTDIAKSCPVSKVLQGEIIVRTFTFNDNPAEKQIKYENEDIAVLWKPDVCKHSGRCVTQLPGVFNTQKHPWVNMKGAITQEIIAQVNKCPTGALSIQQRNQIVET